MSSETISLRGVLPPIPTPFDQQGELHLGAFTENLERWNQYSLLGYVVLGSNGEGVFLSTDEKVQVWEHARRAIPSDKLLVAGTGCESTRETIALTRKAAQAGADAALVVTPHYYTAKMTTDSLLHHYTTLADASPIPILIYNVPKFTNVNTAPDMIARASQHPNIVGMKDTSGNIAQIADTVRLASSGFQVLAGSASFAFASFAVGAVGGIMALANVAPQQAIDLHQLHSLGKWDEGAELQRRVIPANAAVTSRFGIAGLKAAMDMLGYYGGPVRSPLLNLTTEEHQCLKEILIAGGILT